ncbi:response regulator [bacterium]|nr:response regulator [bacterium]
MTEKKLIMVADDEESIRMLLKQLLEVKGFEVVEASDGGEVIDLIEKKHIMPDLLILDIMMPVKNGYEVCEKLRSSSIYAAIPILMLTALSTPESMIKGLTIGADDYITKPFDIDNLVKRINNILGRGNISKKISYIIDNYKKARDKIAKEDETYKKLIKIPILPNIFETLKKFYEEEFFITYISTEEIIKYKDIFSWKIINEFLENFIRCSEEQLTKKFGDDILFIRKIGASDFLVFLKSKIQIKDISSAARNILQKQCFTGLSEFNKLPFTCIANTVKIEYSKKIEFETSLFMSLYDVIKGIKTSRKNTLEDYYKKLIFDEIDYKNVKIIDSEKNQIGYFIKILVNGIGICGLFDEMEEDKLREIYENIFTRIAEKYGNDTMLILPIPVQIIDSEFLLFLMKFKHMKNVHLALSDINLWEKVFFLKEYLEKIRDMGFKLALFDYGTYTSNIDTIFTVKPEYVFLHSFIFISFEKNYIKQEIVKSIVQLEDKIGIKIVSVKKYEDKLKAFNVKYFWGE